MVVKQVGERTYLMKGGTEGKGVKTAWSIQWSYNRGYSKWRCGRGHPVGGLNVPGARTLPYLGTAISISYRDYRPRRDLSRCLLHFGSVVECEHGELCLSRLERAGITLADCFVEYQALDFGTRHRPRELGTW